MKDKIKEYQKIYHRERRARVTKQHKAMLKLIKKHLPNEYNKIVEMV